jgi:recombination protein RecT
MMPAQDQAQPRNGNGNGEVVPVDKRQWLALPFEAQLASYEPQFAAALPAHIKPEKFRRVVITAINQNPDLLHADRRSLFNACVRAASDGLLPDGRQGALVVFNTKVKRGGREEYVEMVQWMVMIQGILTRARNTGELAAVSAEIVFERDKFRMSKGDDPRIEHEPYIGDDAGKVIGAYAIASLKDGYTQREWMTIAQIEKARAQSRAPNSLMWSKFWSEGARKTVARRMFKWLPTSSDLSSLFDRDDQFPDEQEAPHIIPPRPTRAQFAAPSAGLEAPAEPVAAEPAETHDPETGEIRPFAVVGVTGLHLSEHDSAADYASALRLLASGIIDLNALAQIHDFNEPQWSREDFPAELAGELRADFAQWTENLKAASKRGARKPAEQGLV